MPKRITVKMIAQLVSTDNVAVGFDGEEFSRGWRSNWEWVNRRKAIGVFCSDSIGKDRRRTILYEGFPKNPLPVLCSCHGKFRLTDSIQIGSPLR